MKKYTDIMEEFTAYQRIVKNNSENTIAAYHRDIEEFFKWYTQSKGLQTVDLEELNKSDIISFLTFLTLDKKNDASSRARKLSSLKTFFKYLVSENAIEKNIAESIDSPKKEKKVPLVLEDDEVSTMLESSNTLYKNQPVCVQKRNHAILRLFLNCGLRVNELVNLSLDNMDLKNCFVKVNGKGNKERIVYMNEVTKQVIQEYLEEYRDKFKPASESKYVFVSLKNEKISRCTINYMVRNLMEVSDIKNKGSVHTLRRTCATKMYRCDEDIRTIQEILGHTNINTTTIYVGVCEQKKQRAGQRVLF